MEELNIKDSPFILIRKGIGVINIICAGLWLLTNLGDLRFFDWIFFSVFLISGGSLLTRGFGTEKTYIKNGDSFLKIKWINRIRAIVVNDSEVERIILTRFKILINRRDKKNITLSLDFLERDQKKEIYNYFIEYAKKRNLELISEY